jgi:hypothetical protein
MRGPDGNGYNLTHPVAAAAWWRDAAKRYQLIADDASGAAARAWDRGDRRGCEVAITVAESALRWCETACAFAEAFECQAWAAVTEDCGTGLTDYADTTAAAEDARVICMMCRDAVRAAVAVRRLGLVLPECDGDTLCAGTAQAAAPE